MTGYDAIVIGGGLHGCSTALHLAMRRRRVLVLERRHVGRHSSGINAGGVRTLGRDTREIALSVAGMELWYRIRDLVDDDCGFEVAGQVKVAETADELATLETRAAEVRALGFDHEEVVDAAELRRLIPAIAPHCVGALVARQDGAADPYRTTFAFGQKARALGVEIHEDEGVVGLERQGDRWIVATDAGRYEAEAVVNCAGAWSAKVAALVGDPVPLKTRASMMIVTERTRPLIKPVVGAVNRKLSFKQTAAGTLVIGGGQQGKADLDREESRVEFRSLTRSAQAATALFPQIATLRITRSWCGIEAETPDHVPVIGFSPRAPRLIHSFGYSGHGFQLGPICGSAVADLVTHGATNLPIAPFRLERFSAAA